MFYIAQHMHLRYDMIPEFQDEVPSQEEDPAVGHYELGDGVQHRQRIINNFF